MSWLAFGAYVSRSGVAPTLDALEFDLGDSHGGDWNRATGSNFVDGASVDFYQADVLIDSSADVRFDSSESLTFLMPELPSGLYDVRVTNPGGRDSGDDGDGLWTAWHPEDENCDGLWLAPYAGSPLVKVASAGASGSNSNLTEATNPPQIAAALHGISGARFEAAPPASPTLEGQTSGDRLQTSDSASNYMSATNSTLLCVFKKRTHHPYAESTYYTLPQLIADENSAFGLVMSGPGLMAGYTEFDSGTCDTVAISAPAGPVHVGVARLSGGNTIKCDLDGTQATNSGDACGSIPAGVLRAGRNYSSTYFNGTIYAIMARKAVVTDAVILKWRQWAETKYSGAVYPYVISAAPSHVWQLDETSGASAADAVGAFTGTHGDQVSITPGVTVNQTGFFGKAVFYQPGTLGNGYTDFGNVWPKERTDAFSVGGWFKVATNTDGHLISKRDPSTASPNNRRGWYLRVNGGNILFVLANDYSANAIEIKTNDLQVDDSQWHHVIATYAGTSLASGVQIYVDGELSTTTVFQNTLSGTIINTGHLMFGCGGNPSSVVAISKLTGYLDQMQVYDSALTQADATAIHAAGRAGRSVTELDT